MVSYVFIREAGKLNGPHLETVLSGKEGLEVLIGGVSMINHDYFPSRRCI